LPGGGNGQCFHKDILMSLLRLSSTTRCEQTCWKFQKYLLPMEQRGVTTILQ
jgi:hypothetical protein